MNPFFFFFSDFYFDLFQRFPEPSKKDDKGTETDSNKDNMVCLIHCIYCITIFYINIILYCQLYYHKLGTPQSEDVLICKDPENPEYMFSATSTLDGQYIVINITKDCDPVNQLYLIDLKKTDYQIIGR